MSRTETLPRAAHATTPQFSRGFSIIGNAIRDCVDWFTYRHPGEDTQKNDIRELSEGLHYTKQDLENKKDRDKKTWATDYNGRMGMVTLTTKNRSRSIKQVLFQGSGFFQQSENSSEYFQDEKYVKEQKQRLKGAFTHPGVRAVVLHKINQDGLFGKFTNFFLYKMMQKGVVAPQLSPESVHIEQKGQSAMVTMTISQRSITGKDDLEQLQKERRKKHALPQLGTFTIKLEIAPEYPDGAVVTVEELAFQVHDDKILHYLPKPLAQCIAPGESLEVKKPKNQSSWRGTTEKKISQLGKELRTWCGYFSSSKKEQQQQQQATNIQPQNTNSRQS